MYESVGPRFYMKYQGYVSKIAQAMPGIRPSILTSNAPYVEMATTNVVQTALKDADWDYLVFLERDNIAPDDWANVVANELDPEIHKIVGRWYFGKAQEDMRSICGYIRTNGDFDRLSYSEVQYFREHRGLYRVGAGMEGVDDSATTFTVGVGCTAVHRSVFENWTEEMPWFRSSMGWKETPEDSNGLRGRISMVGHDINFCMAAARQGYHVWIDTREASGHIGEFVSNDETYTASAKYAESKGIVNLLTSENVPTTGIPTAMAEVELDRLNELAVGKTVLEIGSRYGASTIGMAGSGAAVVYALDWHKGDKWHEAAGAGVGDTLTQFWLHVYFYKLRDKIIPLVGSSQQVLPLLQDETFDLIFVDGDHSYEGASYDFQQALRLLKPGGTIAIHDYERELKLTGYQGTPLEIGVTRAADELLGSADEQVDSLAIYHMKRPVQGLHVLAAS
jgi:predicted O-methyltransferase YrrM